MFCCKVVQGEWIYLHSGKWRTGRQELCRRVYCVAWQEAQSGNQNNILQSHLFSCRIGMCLSAHLYRSLCRRIKDLWGRRRRRRGRRTGRVVNNLVEISLFFFGPTRHHQSLSYWFNLRLHPIRLPAPVLNLCLESICYHKTFLISLLARFLLCDP